MQEVLSLFLGESACSFAPTLWQQLVVPTEIRDPFRSAATPKKPSKPLSVEVTDDMADEDHQMDLLNQVEEKIRKKWFQGIVMYYNSSEQIGSKLSAEVPQLISDLYPRSVKLGINMCNVVPEKSSNAQTLAEAFYSAKSLWKTQGDYAVDMRALMKKHIYFPGMSSLIPIATWLPGTIQGDCLREDDSDIQKAIQRMLNSPWVQTSKPKAGTRIQDYMSATLYIPEQNSISLRRESLLTGFSKMCKFNAFCPCEVTVSAYKPQTSAPWEMMSALCNSKAIKHYVERLLQVLMDVTQTRRMLSLPGFDQDEIDTGLEAQDELSHLYNMLSE